MAFSLALRLNFWSMSLIAFSFLFTWSLSSSKFSSSVSIYSFIYSSSYYVFFADFLDFLLLIDFDGSGFRKSITFGTSSLFSSLISSDSSSETLSSFFYFDEDSRDFSSTGTCFLRTTSSHSCFVRWFMRTLC